MLIHRKVKQFLIHKKIANNFIFISLLFDKNISEIDDEVQQHEIKIKSVFKQIHELLNDREQELLQKLTIIADDKKHKLKQETKKLDQQSTQSYQVIAYILYKIILFLLEFSLIHFC